MSKFGILIWTATLGFVFVTAIVTTQFEFQTQITFGVTFGATLTVDITVSPNSKS